MVYFNLGVSLSLNFDRKWGQFVNKRIDTTIISYYKKNHNSTSIKNTFISIHCTSYYYNLIANIYRTSYSLI